MNKILLRPIHTLAWFAAMMTGILQGAFFDHYTKGIFWLLASITVILAGNLEDS
jgi:hypothetical protein